MLHTTSVKVVPPYSLQLAFNNGEQGLVDLSDELWGDVFTPLKIKNKQQNAFSTAYQHPVMQTVAWENGADLAPEFLLALLKHQKNTVKSATK